MNIYNGPMRIVIENIKSPLLTKVLYTRDCKEIISMMIDGDNFSRAGGISGISNTSLFF